MAAAVAPGRARPVFFSAAIKFDVAPATTSTIKPIRPSPTFAGAQLGRLAVFVAELGQQKHATAVEVGDGAVGRIWGAVHDKCEGRSAATAADSSSATSAEL